MVQEAWFARELSCHEEMPAVKQAFYPKQKPIFPSSTNSLFLFRRSRLRRLGISPVARLAPLAVVVRLIAAHRVHSLSAWSKPD